MYKNSLNLEWLMSVSDDLTFSSFGKFASHDENLTYIYGTMTLDGLPTKYYCRETNKRVNLPTNKDLRLLVNSADVLHSWTTPSFGLKIDAYPGRLNQVNLFMTCLKSIFEIFFGQCSEIRETDYGFMPIVIVPLSTIQFHHYIMTKLDEQVK